MSERAEKLRKDLEQIGPESVVELIDAAFDEVRREAEERADELRKVAREAKLLLAEASAIWGKWEGKDKDVDDWINRGYVTYSKLCAILADTPAKPLPTWEEVRAEYELAWQDWYYWPLSDAVGQREAKKRLDTIGEKLNAAKKTTSMLAPEGKEVER
jgi:hypothetical protein